MNLGTLSNKKLALVALTAIGVMLGVVLFALLSDPKPSDAETGFQPDRGAFEARGESVDLSSVDIERQLKEDGIHWQVSTYESSEGLCLAVHGELISAPEEAGGIESCGTNARPFDWTVGGVALGDEWFTIAVGKTPPSGHVEVVLRDGSVLSDPEEHRGIWLAIVRTDTLDEDSDVIRIRAWDAFGSSLGSVEPDPLSDVTRAFEAAEGTR